MKWYSSLLVAGSLLLAAACGGGEQARPAPEASERPETDSDTVLHVDPIVEPADSSTDAVAPSDTIAMMQEGPSGTWRTTMGELHLEAEGCLVRGDYPLGTLEGELEGTTLRFDYSESSIQGEGIFEFDRSFDSFSGHQRIGDQELLWEGTRLEGAEN